jgi:hypothetical protein
VFGLQRAVGVFYSRSLSISRRNIAQINMG